MPRAFPCPTLAVSQNLTSSKLTSVTCSIASSMSSSAWTMAMRQHTKLLTADTASRVTYRRKEKESTKKTHRRKDNIFCDIMLCHNINTFQKRNSRSVAATYHLLGIRRTAHHQREVKPRHCTSTRLRTLSTEDAPRSDSRLVLPASEAS